MRTLKAIYPRYQDRVNFLAIGYDPLETAQILEAFRLDQEYPWLTYRPEGDMLVRFDVRIRDTKLAVDRNGVIVFREGYGGRPAEGWDALFRQLAEG